MTSKVIDLQDFQQQRENERLDAEYAELARQQGKTVEQLEEEYLEYIDQQNEKDPEYKAWLESQKSSMSTTPSESGTGRVGEPS